VYCVPEAATMLLSGGAKLGDTPEQFYVFEMNLIQTQMALEDHFINIAKSTGEPSVIIMDRGAMDSQAFLTPDMWRMLLDENGWSTVQLRDTRYDGVIHLVSAARGAEKFYTTANNNARKETVEQAKELDLKVLDAWVGHTRLRVIDNSADFKEKIRRVNEAVCQLAGVPAPKKSERRFLMTGPPNSELLPKHVETFNVTLKYVKKEHAKEKATARLKRREQNKVSSYSVSIGNSDTVEERIVTAREYLSLEKQADPTIPAVKKEQICFLHDGQSYIVNHYQQPKGLWILETHTDGTGVPVKIPDAVKVVEEVTGKPEYTAKGISQ